MKIFGPFRWASDEKLIVTPLERTGNSEPYCVAHNSLFENAVMGRRGAGCNKSHNRIQGNIADDPIRVSNRSYAMKTFNFGNWFSKSWNIRRTRSITRHELGS